MKPIVVLTTLPSTEKAEEIANILIQKKLAACVQISSPVTSIYRWEDKVQKDSEVQLWIKSSTTAYSELELALKELHPYDIPEILSLPVESGLAAYLDWMDGELK